MRKTTVALLGGILAAAVGCVPDAMVREKTEELDRARSEMARLDREIKIKEERIRNMRSELSKDAPNPMEQVRQEMAAQLEKLGLKVTRRGMEVSVTVADRILFDSGETKIKSAAKRALQKVADEIKTRCPYNLVRVEGHTDNVAPKRVKNKYPTNWHLSSARALAVVQFLLKEGGIAPEQVYASGFGEFRPVSSNATNAGKSKNRRVEIVILPTIVGESASNVALK